MPKLRINNSQFTHLHSFKGIESQSGSAKMRMHRSHFTGIK